MIIQPQGMEIKLDYLTDIFDLKGELPESRYVESEGWKKDKRCVSLPTQIQAECNFTERAGLPDWATKVGHIVNLDLYNDLKEDGKYRNPQELRNLRGLGSTVSQRGADFPGNELAHELADRCKTALPRHNSAVLVKLHSAGLYAETYSPNQVALVRRPIIELVDRAIADAKQYLTQQPEATA